MQYALVNGERQEPQPGLRGACPLCGDPAVAKCGNVNTWHWSHLEKLSCDPWWENETEWHRSWKRNFPINWHESIHRAADGERHFADVKTENGWVLEFQHSQLETEERQSRNAFYEKLVWVVDGLRRKTDQKKFLSDLSYIGTAGGPIIGQIYTVRSEKSALLRDWSSCNGTVFFDFGGPALWCLLPNTESKKRLVVEFSRSHFVQIHNFDETQLTLFSDFVDKICTRVGHFADRTIGEGSIREELRELPVKRPQRNQPLITHSTRRRFRL